MKFAISNIAWSSEERLKAYDAMVEAGVLGLEIAPSLFFSASKTPFCPSANEIRTAMSEIKSREIALVSMQSLLFGVAGAGLFEGSDARSNLVNGLERATNLAGQLGIPNLVFGSPRQRCVPEGLAHEEAIDQAAEVFYRLGEVAKAAGTKIAIEANPAAYGTNFLNSLDEAIEFVGHVGHPAIMAILDLGAMYMNADHAALPYRIPTMMPVLNHVHVSEPHLAPAPQQAETLAPVLSALAHAQYDKFVSIEMKRSDDGIESVKAALKRLVIASKSVVSIQ